MRLFKPQGTQITLKITSMHCPSCAINIDNTLEDTDGVFDSQTSYAKSQLKINYDPAKVSLSQLKNIIEQLGYKIEK